MLDISTQRFELAAFGFAVQSLAIGTARSLGVFALFGGNSHRLNQNLQSYEGILLVLLLGAVLLGFDDDNAVFGDAAIL